MIFDEANSNGRWGGERDSEPGDSRPALVADHDIGHASAGRLGQPRWPDRGHSLAQAVEPRVSGDVAVRPIAERGHDREVLLLARRHQTFLRIDLERDDMRIIVSRSRRAFFQPQRQQPIGRRVVFKPLAAPVGNGQRGLEQKQTLFGSKRGHAPLFGALDDRDIVGFRFESQERKLESSLAALRAMARPLVAAQLGQERHDLVAEADRPGQSCLRHFDRNVRLAGADAHHDFARAVGDRQDRTVIADADPSRAAGFDFRLNCQVALRSLGVDAQDDQPLRRLGTGEPDPGRVDFEL